MWPAVALSLQMLSIQMDPLVVPLTVSEVRSNQTLVLAQALLSADLNTDQISIQTTESRDGRVERGGFPETTVMNYLLNHM